MSTDPPPLRADGQRVWVRTVRAEDLASYQRAVHRSRDRLRRWNPVNPHDLTFHLRNQADGHRTFIIRARRPEADHDIVGRVNVTNVVRGRAQSAAMGYDAYDPYAGRGLFAEGLRLVVDLAFAAEPAGMGLNRLEASVQPGNLRSAGMLRSLGFQRRGAWPDYLWIPDARGQESWRPHVTYGVTSAEWPSVAYRVQVPPRPVVLLAEADELAATALATELAVPVLAVHTIVPAGGLRLLGRLLAAATAGAVVVGPLSEAAQQWLMETCGLTPQRVLVHVDTLGHDPRDTVAVALAARARAAGWQPESVEG